MLDLGEEMEARARDIVDRTSTLRVGDRALAAADDGTWFVAPQGTRKLKGQYVALISDIELRQLQAVTQARVWGQMGNARRFSLEDS